MQKLNRPFSLYALDQGFLGYFAVELKLKIQ